MRIHCGSSMATRELFCASRRGMNSELEEICVRHWRWWWCWLVVQAEMKSMNRLWRVEPCRRCRTKRSFKLVLKTSLTVSSCSDDSQADNVVDICQRSDDVTSDVVLMPSCPIELAGRRPAALQAYRSSFLPCRTLVSRQGGEHHHGRALLDSHNISRESGGLDGRY